MYPVSGQCDFPDRVLRLGGLRRDLRPADAVLSVLEEDKPGGGDRRYGRRSRYGIPLETGNFQSRRSLCDL